MTTKLYTNTDDILAGITLQDASRPENNNMALHCCKNEEDVLQNRLALANRIGYPLSAFVCANQTHSDHFAKITKADCGKGALKARDAINDTDALYTYEKDIVLSTFTADCVPVLFYVKDQLIGAIHSGWQGTVKEISRKLFTHLKDVENIDLTKVFVHIGTALSQRRFEVDRDVYDLFQALSYADDFMYYDETTAKYHIDNQKTVQRQCELAGIPTENISIEKICTFDCTEGFSYRQDRQAGRHLSFIVRK